MKRNINISTSFNIGIYLKSRDYGIYLELSIQFFYYFCFYTYIVKRKFVIRKSNIYFRGYCSKGFYQNLIWMGKMAMLDKQISYGL